MSLNSTQLEAIQLFINDKISPGVQAHGGDVVIESFENNILTLTLQGACGSCGIQAYTSESVSNYILEEFPDLDDVIVSMGE